MCQMLETEFPIATKNSAQTIQAMDFTAVSLTLFNPAGFACLQLGRKSFPFWSQISSVEGDHIKWLFRADFSSRAFHLYQGDAMSATHGIHGF